MSKTTLVLGASPNPSRMSHRVTRRLRKQGYPVRALGARKGSIRDVDIEIGAENFPNEGIHTVTMYLSPGRQEQYARQILDLKPERIIFNPGAENSELCQQAEAEGIECMFACTMVMLSLNQY